MNKEYLLENNTINSFIDYYEEMNDYKDHIEIKKSILKEKIIIMLEDMGIEKLETDNVTATVYDRQNKNKENLFKEKIIEMIIEDNKEQHIKVIITENTLALLRKDNRIFEMFKKYIDDEVLEKSKYHNEIVRYIMNKKKIEFLDINLGSRRNRLIFSDEKKSTYLKKYEKEERKNKVLLIKKL